MKTDGTANPVTLTLGDKLKIIDELEGSAVCNFAETGSKQAYKKGVKTYNFQALKRSKKRQEGWTGNRK